MPSSTYRTHVLCASLLLLMPASLSVKAEDTAGNSPDIWGQTRDTAADWWRESRDFAGQALQDAKTLFTEQEDFNRVWKSVVPTLDEALILEERQADLPEKSWFGADQRSNRGEIDALLDEAVDILTISPALNNRDRIQALQDEILTARTDIADYRQKRVSAPTESTIKKTVADYDDLIAAREADIARAAEQITQLKHEFGQELRGMGLELSDEQLEFLLSTVVGDTMVDLGILFDNVKSITLQLEELVEQSGEDLQNARRYYGLYVVLLKSLNRMHLKIEEAIGERYLPQIDGIIAQAQSLAGETQRLLRESPDKQDLLNANLEAQQLTIQAAGVYRQYLQDQAKQVEKARLELDKDIAAAWNTYETVRVSGELVGLVRSSQQLLEGLMNRQIPTLRPFENLEMQREIQQLTQRLRSGEQR
ncbi:hypothetical protein [Thiocystis violacea]|uniref:hypothetical protein n=1 Tax=Thiocystis violacea TaxID=13725 RepID=UPI0019041A5B|nr:hypothetical protein [Thiocystis violacea]MBK1720905.1 hypothetical protein [Thiocystis violacea]